MTSEDLNADLVALGSCHFSVGNEDKSVILGTAISVQLLTGLEVVGPLVVDGTIVVEVSEDAPVWSWVLSLCQRLILISLLLQVLYGGLSCFIKLGILTEISFLLEISNLILEFTFLSSIIIDAVDDLNELNTSLSLEANTNIHRGGLLELHLQLWLLVL